MGDGQSSASWQAGRRLRPLSWLAGLTWTALGLTSILVDRAYHRASAAEDASLLPGDLALHLAVCLAGLGGLLLFQTVLGRRLEAQARLADALAQVQERLVASERLAVLGTLSAGLAHEIASPLVFVTSNTQVALEQLALAEAGEPMDLDATREALQDALEGARRIRSMVDDVRRLSRPGQAEALTDLGEVVRAALALARPFLSGRARLEVALPILPPVRCSGDRLTQVFTNLLINAAQAIPEQGGPGLIGLSGRLEGRCAVVEVRDSGTGIRAEDLPRIFEPFFTTKPSGLGTGLGLAISQGIVQASGGVIEVESRAGAGSTFRVILPAWPEAAPADGGHGATGRHRLAAAPERH